MSESQTTMSSDLHRECWTMLPWFVTSRVSAHDRKRIERHLLECADCRTELDAQRAICEHMRGDEAVLLAPNASLQKLMARIDGASPVTPSSEAQVSQRSKAAGPARWLAVAAAVQTIAIGALLTLLWQQRESEISAPRFITLSEPTTIAGQGPILRIVFSNEATANELQDLLHGIGAQVVAGPSEAGVYTLRLHEELEPRDVASTLQSVRAHPEVIFAEHVSAEHAR